MQNTSLTRCNCRVACAAVLFLLLLVVSAAARDLPVQLSANYLNYDEDHSLVIASGEVHITMEAVSMRADRMILNTDTEILTAEGNVQISTDGYDAFVDGLNYEVSSEVTRFSSFHSALAPSGINGKIFITSKDLVDNVDHLKGKDCSVTTCDYSSPHYVLKSHQVVMYPHDKIVGFGNTYYVNGVPILWLPVLYYSLQNQSRKMPVFGHNDVEGDFLKTSFDYWFDQQNYGLVYLDWMSKKGLGTGFDRNYRLNDTNQGTFYFYHLNEADTGITDWVTKIRHQIDLNSTTRLILGYQAAQMYMIPSGRKDQTIGDIIYTKRGSVEYNIDAHSTIDRLGNRQDTSFNWGARSGSFSTTYNYSNSRGIGDTATWSNISQRFGHSQPLWIPNLTMSTNWQYFRNAQDNVNPANEKLTPDLRLNYKGTFYTVDYYMNDRIDLDRDTNLADLHDEYRVTQPEINVNINPLVSPVANFYPTYSYGWYHEAKYNPGTASMRNFSASRQSYGLRVAKDFGLGFGQRFSYEDSIAQYNYSPGDERYQLNEKYEINSAGFNFFNNTIGFRRGYFEGSSPFFFDRAGSIYSNLDEVMTWFWGTLINWRTHGGYNFMTNKYLDVDTTLVLKPLKDYSQTVRTGWSIENQRFLDLYTNMRYSPNKYFSLDGDLTYDLNYGLIKTASDRLAFEIDPDNWRTHMQIKIGHSYDFFTQEYKMRELILVKDLHCWEMTYRYNDLIKETSVSFSLKAFPDQPLGWTTGRGLYFEGFEKGKAEFEQQFNQPSPTRI